MTILPLPTNRRAERSVARAHADRALQLVTLLTAGGAVDHRPLAAAALRRVATCRSLSRREFELVAAAVDVCAAHSDPEAPERLVLLLTDVDGWAEAEVGDA
ncbi:MAG TPA: hypothetical protein VFH54_14870, partial [Mycobacteriales bacterium]|nr:hypothetical protein [Mycobacteriales bacterium]